MLIEIRDHYDEETDQKYRAIFVEDELFDWGMSPDDLRKAKALIKTNPNMYKSVMGDIEKYFVSSFSEFLNEDITLTEINAALASGVI